MKALLALSIPLIALQLMCFDINGQNNPNISGSEWNDVLESGSGDITFYWYRSVPLIYLENDTLKGIEYEIANAFKHYIENQYEVNLRSKWINASKFEDLIDDIGQARGAVFGMAGVSITESRKSILQFTPPHLNDLCVIVSSPNVAVEHTINGFIKSLEGLTALTVQGSTFEQKLVEIQHEHDIVLKYEYINSTSDMLAYLENMDDGIGYLELPSYLIALNEGSPVRRQYFYPLKLPGLSLIYPKESDWKTPVEAYYGSSQFQNDKDSILNKYLGRDIIELMEKIARTADMGPEEEIIILTKERELQYEELLEQTLQRQRDQWLMYIMLMIIVILILLAAIFYTRYRVKLTSNMQLAEKQAVIESKNAELTDLNDEKNHLMGLLAHDLRAPIGRIIGLCQLMLHDANKEQTDMLELIVKDAEKLNTLIIKILDAEAIENHQHNLIIEEVDAVEVINELINDYRVQASDKDIRVVTHFAHEKMMCRADKVYLYQALENLLSNALKFSNPGTTVRITTDDQNVIHIQDQGPGFTDEDKLKVFKKFQKLSAKPTGGEHSTGLGMTNVRLFIELMKGEVSFDSKVNEGTTFHIKLPALKKMVKNIIT